MSMYADYLKEHHNDEMVETEHGFAIYRYLQDNAVYIVDIYVVPDYRKSDKAGAMADKIVEAAKVRGCTKLIGTVVPTANGSTTSLKVLLGYGMKLQSSQNNLIFFEKAI